MWFFDGSINKKRWDAMKYDFECQVETPARRPAKRLAIAIDFDDTFTADPDMWAEFIRNNKQRGHSFYCVTNRKGSEENVDMMNEQFDKLNCQMTIIFANELSKLDTVEQLGLTIDIWIDDSPYSLTRS